MKRWLDSCPWPIVVLLQNHVAGAEDFDLLGNFRRQVSCSDSTPTAQLSFPPCHPLSTRHSRNAVVLARVGIDARDHATTEASVPHVRNGARYRASTRRALSLAQVRVLHVKLGYGQSRQGLKGKNHLGGVDRTNELILFILNIRLCGYMLCDIWMKNVDKRAYVSKQKIVI